MMPSEEFTCAIDCLSVYATVYNQLATSDFSSEEETTTLRKLEEMISNIVEKLYANKGQVA